MFPEFSTRPIAGGQEESGGDRGSADLLHGHHGKMFSYTLGHLYKNILLKRYAKQIFLYSVFQTLDVVTLSTHHSFIPFRNQSFEILLVCQKKTSLSLSLSLLVKKMAKVFANLITFGTPQQASKACRNVVKVKLN